MSDIEAKERKWPGAKRKRVFKNRVKKNIEAWIANYNDRIPLTTDKHRMINEALNIVIHTLESDDFKKRLK